MNEKIEKYLDHFLAGLRHTIGPWFFTEDFDIKRDGKPPHAQAFWDNIFYTHDIAYQNALLISEAPSLLRFACKVYLTLNMPIYEKLSKVNDWQLTFDTEDLRNLIATATGLQEEYVEMTFSKMVEAVLAQAPETRETLTAEFKDFCENNGYDFQSKDKIEPQTEEQRHFYSMFVHRWEAFRN